MATHRGHEAGSKPAIREQEPDRKPQRAGKRARSRKVRGENAPRFVKPIPRISITHAGRMMVRIWMRASGGCVKRYSPVRRRHEGNRGYGDGDRGKSVYNHLMNTPFVTAPVASSGEDVDGRLEADIRRLETMVPQMAAAAQAAEIDARARLAALHERIA